MLFALLVYVLYSELSKTEVRSDIWNNFIFQMESKAAAILIWLAVLLAPLNWLLESKKWQILINRANYKLAIWPAFKAVIAGSTLGLITPSRIGDYGGRILLLPSEYNWWGMLATLTCSLSQNLVNLIFGFFGIFYFGGALLQSFSKDKILLISIVLLVFGFILFLVLQRGIANTFFKNLFKSLGLRKWFSILSDIRNIDLKSLLSVLFLSIIRYLVYAIQLALLLWFFGAEIEFQALFAGIALLFLMQSGLPLPPLISVMARAEAALLIWKNYEVNEFSVVAATFSIWIINLILPALLGMIVIFKINLMKSLGYDSKNENN